MNGLDQAPSMEERAERAFETYREAAAHAQRTLVLADGIAAGRAWAAFLAVFDPPLAAPALDVTRSRRS